MVSTLSHNAVDAHPIELRERFLAKGIPVRIGVESREEMLAEGTAARRMRAV
jgi:hypothetical protein